MFASADQALALTADGSFPVSSSQDIVNSKQAKAMPKATSTPLVYGKTIGNHGQAWWQWALNYPLETNPIKLDGKVNCSSGQSGKVWFLAGTFGETANRTCTIQKNKALFFPIINGIYWTPLPPAAPEDCVDEADCRKLVSDFINLALTWTCTVDNIPCVYSSQIVRAQSDALPLNIPLGSLANTDPNHPYTPGLRELSIADGYWVMLDPLSPGKHTLHFTASNNSPFALDVTYNLTVK